MQSVGGTTKNGGWGQDAWSVVGERIWGVERGVWNKNQMFPMPTTSVSSKGGWMRAQGDIRHYPVPTNVFLFNHQCAMLNMTGASSEISSDITHNLLSINKNLHHINEMSKFVRSAHSWELINYSIVTFSFNINLISCLIFFSTLLLTVSSFPF